MGYWSGAWRDATNDGTVSGTYTRVGRLCYVVAYLNNVQISGNAVGTFAAIWNLPFTAVGHAGSYSVLSVSHSNIFDNCNAGNFYVTQGTHYALSSQYGDNDYDYCTWSGSDTRYMMFSGCYQIS